MSVRSVVALARQNAAACELAAGTRCRCHCAGALHGKRHEEADIIAAALEALPPETPTEDVAAELSAQLERAAVLRAQLSLEFDWSDLSDKPPL